MERNLKTKDRQKKLLDPNVTGKECEGNMRGLNGLPWAEAKVLEGYFSGHGVPPEKCDLKIHSLVHRPTAPQPEKEPR